MSAVATASETERPWILAATIVASSMAFIDGSVVNIALPAMQRGFGADIADMQWVSNAYLLLLGSLILVGGGLGDRVGRRLIFMIGIVLFALASIFCAAAPTVQVLIVGRLVQGIGAALLVPQSPRHHFGDLPEGGPRPRHRHLGRRLLDHDLARPAARRVPRRPPLLARRLLDQHPARRDRALADLRLRAGKQGRGRQGRHRLVGRGDRGARLRRA